jgi:hypothetical protein
MKQFMEKELGWKALKVRLSGHDTIYLMKSGKHLLQLEAKSDGSYTLMYNQESRTVPNLETITKALNLKQPATKLDQARILDQVIDKLIRKNRGYTEAEVHDMMERFANGHL